MRSASRGPTAAAARNHGPLPATAKPALASPMNPRRLNVYLLMAFTLLVVLLGEKPSRGSHARWFGHSERQLLRVLVARECRQRCRRFAPAQMHTTMVPRAADAAERHS